MSLSKPFFNTKVTYKKRPIVIGLTDDEYNRLHWTEQLRLRPLRTQPHRDYNVWNVDFDNRLDNWDDPEGEK